MASDDEQSFQERQEDELQVLQSMYIDDVEDLRTKTAWNVWQPVKVKVKLYPQESQGPHSQVFAQVEMIITCPPRYPDDIPTIELQNPKNVPEKKLFELRQELIEMARECIGEVMIMNLAEKVREFLHTYNKPPAKSFHDQMLEKQRRAEEERAQRQQEQQEKERCQREEEMREVEMARRRIQLELIEERNETRFKKGVTPPLGEEGVSGSPPVAASAWPGISPIMSASPPRPDSADASVFVTPLHPAPVSVARKRLTSTPRRSSESDTEEMEGRPKSNSTACTLVFNKGQEERHVQRGKQQASKGGGGSAVYRGVDQVTGEEVVVTEWAYRWRTVAKKSHIRNAHLEDDKEGLSYLKQVMGIEQEAVALARLSHPNIIRFLGFRYQRDPGKITVHVLSEYCRGSSLDPNLRDHRPVPLERLRDHTGGMLQALHYLHEHGTVHRLFRASCVFVDLQGKVRLGDYAIDKRLRELYREIEKACNRVMFEDSTDKMPPPFGRGSTKKGDIYQLGVTVLALSMGDYITNIVPEVPKTLHPALVDFLNKCLIRDNGQRWGASQLLEHQFLKEPLTAPLTPPACGKHGARRQESDKDKGDSNDETNFVEFRTSLEQNGRSRLTQEFHVEKTLGKGGFGDVLKVTNKLDRQVYAIKRIMINTRSRVQFRKINREVNLLSRLNHENIVRYYNAWMESTDEPACSDTSSGSTMSSKPTPSPSSLSPKATPPGAAKKRKNSLDLFDDVEDLAVLPAEASEDWSVSRSLDATAHKPNDDSSDDEDDDDDGGHWGLGGIGASFMQPYNSDDSVDFRDRSATPSSENLQMAESQSQHMFQMGTPQAPSEEEPPMLRCLYIQMQYCEKSTLRRAIDQGLYKNMDRVWKYFREITEGLLYIHEQKIIHRDLKPVNIFLDAHDLVKIGDFGLATTDFYKKKTGLADSTMTAPTFIDPNSSRSGVGGSGDGDMTGEVGTALYISPEMMKGSSKLRYDQKVDMYSLGIIFFEMVYRPLDTSMERLKVLTSLRKEEILFPDDFSKDGSLLNQEALLRQMLNHNPSQRPSSKELLQSPNLPAVQEAEFQFHQRLEEAVRNPESQTYQRIFNQFFSHSSSMAMDKTYNMDQSKSKMIMYPCYHCQLKFRTKKEILSHYNAIHFHVIYNPEQPSLLKIHFIKLTTVVEITVYISTENDGYLFANASFDLAFLMSDEGKALVGMTQEPFEHPPSDLTIATQSQTEWWAPKLSSFFSFDFSNCKHLSVNGPVLSVNGPVFSVNSPVLSVNGPVFNERIVPSPSCLEDFMAEMEPETTSATKRQRLLPPSFPFPEVLMESEVEETQSVPAGEGPVIEDPRKKALAVLQQGRMPFVVAAPRVWSIDGQITLPGGEAWPPEGSTTMDGDEKLLNLEALALNLAKRAELPRMSRRELVDTFSFLTLPGTAYPQARTNPQKSRALAYVSVCAVASGDVSDSTSVTLVNSLFEISPPTGFIANILDLVKELNLRISK